MSVKLRLTRVGKKKTPMYRVVVADERAPRDGRFIEIIGQYQPLDEPSMINIKDERALYWLSQGAQPTETVLKLLMATGVWEQYEKTRPKKSLAKAAVRKKAVEKGHEVARQAHAEKKKANEPVEPIKEAPAKAQEATASAEPEAQTETTESE